MILSEYEAAEGYGMDSYRKLEEIGEREAAHKMELSVKYQAECKKIQSQIGQLKKKQKRIASEVSENNEENHAYCVHTTSESIRQ